MQLPSKANLREYLWASARILLRCLGCLIVAGEWTSLYGRYVISPVITNLYKIQERRGVAELSLYHFLIIASGYVVGLALCCIAVWWATSTLLAAMSGSHAQKEAQ